MNADDRVHPDPPPNGKSFGGPGVVRIRLAHHVLEDLADRLVEHRPVYVRIGRTRKG
jgi:hypothetical protein